jgi:hypothetical protein
LRRGAATLDGEDRSERIRPGRKGEIRSGLSPTIKPEFPLFLVIPRVPTSPHFSNEEKKAVASGITPFVGKTPCLRRQQP